MTGRKGDAASTSAVHQADALEGTGQATSIGIPLLCGEVAERGCGLAARWHD